MSLIQDVKPENALIWLDFQDQFDVGGLKVVKNKATAQLAPKFVTVGDGTTTSTFPSQLVGRGVSFDGAISNKRLNCGSINLDKNNPFTMAFVFKLATSTTGELFSNFDQATTRGSFIQVASGFETGGTLMLSICSNASTGNYLQVRGPLYTLKNKRLQFCFVTYNGTSSASGVSLYQNDSLLTPNVNANGLTLSSVTSDPLYLGVRKNASSFSNQLEGSVYHASLFPQCFDSQQIKYLYNLLVKSTKI